MTTIDTLWVTLGSLLFAAVVVALAGVRPLPPGGRRCRRCGYDLTATPDGHRRCPECGGSLVGGVVETSTSDGVIRRRRWLARIGFSGISIVVILALVVGFLDPRRLPWTPTAWLVRVDAPLALRMPDDFARPVLAEFWNRSFGGGVDDAAVEALARTIVDRFDRPGHGGPAGRFIVVEAWDRGLLADEEVAALPWTTGTLTLQPQGRPNTRSIEYAIDLDVDLVSAVSLPGIPAPDFRSTIRLLRAGVGEPVEWIRRGASSSSRSLGPPNPASSSTLGGRMSRPGGFEPGEDVLQVELEHVVRLIGPSGRELEILDDDHRLSTTIEVHPWIEADVALDRSEEARDELVEDLESSSWFTVGPTGVVTVHLALDRHPWWTLGTPSFDLEDADGRDGWSGTDLGWIRSSRALGNLERFNVRFDGDRKIVDLVGRLVLGPGMIVPDSGPIRLRIDATELDPSLFDHLAASEDADEASAPRKVVASRYVIEIPRVAEEDVEWIPLDPFAEP